MKSKYKEKVLEVYPDAIIMKDTDATSDNDEMFSWYRIRPYAIVIGHSEFKKYKNKIFAESYSTWTPNWDVEDFRENAAISSWGKSPRLLWKSAWNKINKKIIDRLAGNNENNY